MSYFPRRQGRSLPLLGPRARQRPGRRNGGEYAGATHSAAASRSSGLARGPRADGYHALANGLLARAHSSGGADHPGLWCGGFAAVSSGVWRRLQSVLVRFRSRTNSRYSLRSGPSPSRAPLLRRGNGARQPVASAEETPKEPTAAPTSVACGQNRVGTQCALHRGLLPCGGSPLHDRFRARVQRAGPVNRTTTAACLTRA